jgi:glyoxalase family protein
MSKKVSGLHHITTLASEPQANVDFFTGPLGLRLVKRTVFFNDPSVYHLYFGDEVGTPGTIWTSFPYPNMPSGRVGRGQVSATAFTIPDGAVDYWVDRLEAEGVDADEPTERFGETVISLRDHDGQPLELVTGESDIDPWSDGPVPTEYAIRGFHSVTLMPNDPEGTGDVLELLGYEPIAEEATPQNGDWTRYRVESEEDRANIVHINNDPNEPPGQWGAGIVHHSAHRTPTREDQREWYEILSAAGLAPITAKDREYMHSIYFRGPSGINFEVATDPPGFPKDEDVATLGEELRIPDDLEGDHEQIEANLPEITSQY